LPKSRQKELEADTRLRRAWLQFHRDELEEALAGPHRVIVVQVMEFLKVITPASSSALLQLMHSQSWENVNPHTRLVLLHEINQAIMRMREKHGMPPIDDPLPLPGKRENVFRMIKKTLKIPH